MRGLRWVLLISVLSILCGPVWGGSVEVTNDASAVGNYGLAVTLEPDPSAVTYVLESIDLPAGSPISVKFRWRQGTLQRWAQADPVSSTPKLFPLFVTKTGTNVASYSSNRAMAVLLSVRSDEWVLWGTCKNNAGSTLSTSTIPLPASVTDTNTFLEIEIEALPSATDGSCCLRVEGIGEECVTGLVNDQVPYSALAAGLIGPQNMPASLSGTYHIDEVIVRN